MWAQHGAMLLLLLLLLLLLMLSLVVLRVTECARKGVCCARE